MSDIILRGITKDKNVRFFGVDSTETVINAMNKHNLSTTNTVLLGRLLSAGLMMGITLKNENDSFTIKIEGNGPAEKAIVVARNGGKIKGYVAHPEVELPISKDGRINVKEAIGAGVMTIIKDLGLKTPYTGQIELISGEIAEDLTYYFMQSEQTPSAVGLGVLIDENGLARKAGGFIIQLMPSAQEEVIAKLEDNLAKFPNLTDMLDMGHDIKTILTDYILKGFELEFTDKLSASFSCDCSKEKFARGIKLLPKKELEEIIDEGKEIPVTCHFCNATYNFDVNEIQSIYDELK